jgi:hypothetical protein
MILSVWIEPLKFTYTAPVLGMTDRLGYVTK